MSEFELMSQQLDANKKRLESNLATLRSTNTQSSGPTVTPILQKQEPVVPPTSQSLMEQLLQLSIARVESVLTEEERAWFASNILGVPGFLASASGKATTRLVFDELRSWMSK